MSKHIRTGWWAASIATVILCLSSTASAQGWGDPESGDTGEWQPPPEQQQPPQQQPPQEQPPQQQPPQQQPPQQQPPQQPPPQQQQQQQQWFQQGDQETPPGMGGQEQPGQPSGADGDSDHSQVVGAIGVGFFGLNTINMDPGYMDRTSGRTKVRPALIGIRMWFSESLGLDAALGFAFRTKDENATNESDGTVLIGGQDGVFGLDIHVGLPIAVKTWQHFSFLLVPEIDFGYASGTILGLDDPTNDTDLTGLKFVGQLQLAGELQLGFLGVPQLGIQGGLSLGLNWVSETAEDVFVPGDSDPAGFVFKRESSGIGLATGAHIRAVYYFN